MKNSKDIIKEIEKKAEEFGMGNEQVASQYDTGLINALNAGENWKEGFDGPSKKREIKEGNGAQQQIINLFKKELGIKADDHIVWEAAIEYAKKYSSLSDKINA